MTTITVESNLTIKELAPVLRRSVGFLYKCRMAGLPMVRDAETHMLVTKASHAARWIRAKKVRVVNGRVKKG